MFDRYAIYYVPDGALAQLGAAWLGWDIARAEPVRQPKLCGLDLAALTSIPRRYGFHGTIKPPFRLAEGMTRDQLEVALTVLSSRLAPVTLDGLELRDMARSLVLTPRGNQSQPLHLAAQTVRELDRFRAPASAAELARRRKPGLTQAQERNLIHWGYPYTMEEFRLHITLTGPMQSHAQPCIEAARSYFADHIATPLEVGSLTLVGEDAQGMFRQIRRIPLTG